MNDVFSLTSSSFPKTTRVASFRGREAISQPYEFELFLLVPGDAAKDFDFADAAGTKATLAMDSDRQHAFVFHGVLAIVELVHAHGAFALFRAVLVPRLQRLALTHHSRLFTQQSLPDILKQVFDENGLAEDDYSLQLTGSYPTEEHVCQYRETDLAFVSRWMEHVGLYYYFEQGDGAEKLIVTDAKASHTDVPSDPVRYVPSMGDDHSAGEAIESFRCRATSLPASVRLKDYDYTKPTLDVSGSASVSPSGLGEINIYASRAFTPEDAAKLSQIRAQEMLARQLEHFGSSTMHLRAGYQFTLEEHPLDVLNQKYLATGCEHFGNAISDSPDLAKRIDLPYKDVYRCEVTAIPAKVQFRTERRTPWPRVHGLEHGLIDGPADTEYAQIDDHGRYRVKFLFDESPLKDGKASTWVRMMQPHGGGIEGFHFPLRKGTEVVLSFWGGDPDRPVIAGVVNTATTPSPVTTSNHTRNVIQTGGRNRLELEDQDGQQKISLSTPTANTFVKMGATDGGHELTLHTDANSHYDTSVNSDRNTGVNLAEIIGGTLTEQVGGAVQEMYKATHQTTVSGARTLTVNGAYLEKLTAGATRNITGDLVESVSAGVRRSVGGGGVHEMIGGPVSQGISGNLSQQVSGDAVQHISGTYKQTVGSPTLVNFGPATSTNMGTFTSTTIGSTVSTMVGSTSSVTVASAKSVTIGNSDSYCYGNQYSKTFALKESFQLAASLGMTMGARLEVDVSYNMLKTPAMNVAAGSVAFKALKADFKSGQFNIDAALAKIG